ncbi:hypothetical protein QAD02_013137 [Eretmocerus hayati]|uniref:Uncharacterized protein n=1 Tax=Eretmocerus hayati TaxID=131215 RepID=A0ACC2P188_9HYME|nr:hypothetical protein QAD02_013137 [Eretmocerus hayati]
MGTTKRRRKKHIIFNEADLLRCWYALEHKPNSFSPMMLVTEAAYSLKPKYIQLGQIYSVTHGDEDVAEFEVDMDCEEVQDERVEALEDETSFVFGESDELENEEQSSTGARVTSDRENVISAVTGLWIDTKDIEDLFDSDLEGSPEKDDQEIDAVPWRIPFDELYSEDNQPNEVREPFL